MQLEEKTAGNYTVVTVVDTRIDASAADDFRAEIAQIAGDLNFDVTTDFGQIEQIIQKIDEAAKKH